MLQRWVTGAFAVLLVVTVVADGGAVVHLRGVQREATARAAAADAAYRRATSQAATELAALRAAVVAVEPLQKDAPADVEVREDVLVRGGLAAAFDRVGAHLDEVPTPATRTGTAARLRRALAHLRAGLATLASAHSEDRVRAGYTDFHAAEQEWDGVLRTEVGPLPAALDVAKLPPDRQTLAGLLAVWGRTCSRAVTSLAGQPEPSHDLQADVTLLDGLADDFQSTLAELLGATVPSAASGELDSSVVGRLQALSGAPAVFRRAASALAHRDLPAVRAGVTEIQGLWPAFDSASAELAEAGSNTCSDYVTAVDGSGSDRGSAATPT